MTRETEFYLFGRSTYYASHADQRFPYCLYVPEAAARRALEAGTRLPLAVIVHGTDRAVELYRETFIPFADATGCVLLLPLFPAGIGEKGELHGYKYLSSHGVRYDEVLLGMVDDVAEQVPVQSERFLLTGFSGGGHFAHRFLYAHPERLSAVAIGAPGIVTLLDETLPWPAGVGGVRDVLGHPVDAAAVARVAVQVAVGGDDVETWEIAARPEDPFFIAGVNDDRTDRQGRIVALRDSLRAAGASVRHDVVPGAAHDAVLVFPVVRDFFAAHLAAEAAPHGDPEPPGAP